MTFYNCALRYKEFVNLCHATPTTLESNLGIALDECIDKINIPRNLTVRKCNL